MYWCSGRPVEPYRSDVGVEAGQQVQARLVGQVDVEEDQVGPGSAGARLGGGVRASDDGETGHQLDEAGVHLRDPEIVVDDQHADHRSTVGNRHEDRAEIPPGRVGLAADLRGRPGGRRRAGRP